MFTSATTCSTVGRKHGVLRERQAQLSQAKENLAKLTDEVDLSVETAYNELERTQQMVKVSEEVLALRTESNRVPSAGTNTGSGAELTGRYRNGSGIRCQGAPAAVTDGLLAGP